MPESNVPNLPALRCAGVALRGSGYPNASNTLRRLIEAGVQIDDCAQWLPEDFRLWQASRGSATDRLRLCWRLMVGNLSAAVRVFIKNRREHRITYVPYPAIFLLWWLSWVPRRWRPPLIADAYISVWDSITRDRDLSRSNNLIGRMLCAFEGRALRTANAIIVDTTANREWMIEAFHLEQDAVFAIPLAIDDRALLSIPTAVPKKPLKVTYVGTFVPLHGVNILAGAVSQLKDDSAVAFHFVGDGQDAEKLEAQLQFNHANLIWERRWLTHYEITERIASCDVCLGVFGGHNKAARVLPFKLYLALAAGRAVVTQTAFSLPEGTPQPPFITTAADPSELVSALRMLTSDSTGAAQAGKEGRHYYQNWLGARAMLRAWRQVVIRVMHDVSSEANTAHHSD